MLRNLDFIRSLPPDTSIQELGSRLYETISDLRQHQENIAQQTNSNITGQPDPPPAVDGVTVTGQNGHFHVQVEHSAEFYRGVQYHAEYADNPSFHNPRAVDMGSSRELTHFLGDGTYYWRAFASYASSEAGPPAYHGGAHSPQPVAGGGAVGGPAFLPPQGSGTGAPGQGLSGPGPIPFRTSTGAPPIRGKSQNSGGSSGGSLVASPSTGLPAGMTTGTSSGGSSVGFPYIETTQSGLAAIAATFSLSNKGQPVYVTDYDHILYWTGTAWSFRNGDRSDYTQLFNDAPSPLTGWHICDGSAVNYLKSDGTLQLKTIPDLVGSPAYIKLSSSGTGAITAAVAPTLTMNSYTPAGTISALTFTGSSVTTSAVSAGTPAGAVSTPTFSGGTTTFGTNLFTLNAGGSAAHVSPASITASGTVSTPTFSGSPLGTHDHAVTAAGTINTPTFSGTPATLTGTISNTGTPQTIELLPYFRL